MYLRSAGYTIFAVLLLLGGLLAGCASSEPETAPEPQAAKSAVELKLLVVDDPQMAAAIEQLRAEWKARTGAGLSVAQADSAALLAAESLPGSPDAVVYPSRLLGTLAMRGWITRLPDDYPSNRELDWGDTFELLQLAETNWAATPHAVPFGSPVLMLYYRPDLVDAVHKRPPGSWKDLHELAELVANREKLGDAAPAEEAAWHGLVQPLAEGWAGRVLLARAAAYVKHRDHYSALFDYETMEPLIAGPGFVRALEELVADARLGPSEQLEMDPAAAKDAFLSGHAGLAIAWPQHAAGTTKPDAPFPPIGFAELPGSPVMYNFVHNTWEKRESDENWRVPLLATAGRVGSVAASSADARSAFQLLAWLSGRQWGAQVASASPATTLYRRSQVRTPQPWIDRGTDAEAALAYATGVHEALNHQQYLSAPRLPGEEQYMAALDTAVRAAVREEKTPADALAEVAQEWNRITDELGRQEQKQAYRQSLGF